MLLFSGYYRYNNSEIHRPYNMAPGVIIRIEKGKIMANQNTTELRLGILGSLWFGEALQMKMPKQLDLLDYFFPGLLITEIESDENTKQEAEFDDTKMKFRAVRYHGKYYTGGSRRVTQILGRLIGTAKGSREKERVTAARIRKHVADQFAAEPETVKIQKKIITEKLSLFTQEELNRFTAGFSALLENLSDTWNSQDPEIYAAETLSPFTEEVFTALWKDVDYQCRLGTAEGVITAWCWLLFGALLRNDVIRLHTVVLSSLEPRYTENDDRLHRLSDAEKKDGWESFYAGDDLDRRFPGVDWFCDRCGEFLNAQPGFDDHLPEWKCLNCGYVNKLSMDQIWDSKVEYEQGAKSVDSDDFCKALRDREAELQDRKEKKE